MTFAAGIARRANKRMMRSIISLDVVVAPAPVVVFLAFLFSSSAAFVAKSSANRKTCTTLSEVAYGMGPPELMQKRRKSEDGSGPSVSNGDVEEVDVAIIGAGIGGLCAGAILNTLYDKKVGVYESVS